MTQLNFGFKVRIQRSFYLCLNKHSLWIIRAVDRNTNQVIAWLTGNRDFKTAKRLIEKIGDAGSILYSDNWNAFSKALSGKVHLIGKEYTYLIESNNSDVRNCLGRFLRRTKIVSRSGKEVNDALKLQAYFRLAGVF